MSFGNLTMLLSLPEEPVDKADYDQFLFFECNCDSADFDVFLEYADLRNFSVPADSFICTENEKEAVAVSDGGCTVFYKSARGGVYAVRRFDCKNRTVHIILSDEADGNLQMRHILNTVGIEDLAAERGAIILHSSFIERNGAAVLFCGECGIGKSTQADLWSTYRRAHVINGDKAYLFVKDGAVTASGLPFSGSSGICKNKMLRTDAILSLSWGKENSVSRLTLSDAVRSIAKSVYAPHVFFDRCAGAAADIVSKTDVCRFVCTPDFHAVDALEQYLDGRCQNADK